MKSLTVSLPGRDSLTLTWQEEGSQVQSPTLTGVGCSEVMRLIQEWRPRLLGSWDSIAIPEGTSHGEMLLRELLLRAQGRWNPPYQDEELCHCRAVPTKTIKEAIQSGCHTPQKVSQETSASTACGTCRPTVEALIHYLTNASCPQDSDPAGSSRN